MEMRLTKEDIAKIISTLPIEELENRLEYNWDIWDTVWYDNELVLEKQQEEVEKND